jgi:hypothetical protein
MISHDPCSKRRRLTFESFEERLLLTAACSADSSVPVPAEDLAVEISSSDTA